MASSSTVEVARITASSPSKRNTFRRQNSTEGRSPMGNRALDFKRDDFMRQATMAPMRAWVKCSEVKVRNASTGTAST
ncbi:MAG: hypothetical protein EBR54_08760 [Flavobacteriia bacterium]|nr:hypothetical protein [Flavobacteriia bacterium]